MSKILSRWSLNIARIEIYEDRKPRMSMQKSGNPNDRALDDHIEQVFKNHPYIQFAVLFGSMAKGKVRRDSDLDIAVDAGCSLDMNEKMQLIEEFAEQWGVTSIWWIYFLLGSRCCWGK